MGKVVCTEPPVTDATPRYTSEGKARWRAEVYSDLSYDRTPCIVDKEGRMMLKVLELIGNPQALLGQVLSLTTPVISESQVVGVDRERAAVLEARRLYPQGEFLCTTWESFCDLCLREHRFDFGFLNFDSLNTLRGKPFEDALALTVELGCHCAMMNGECLVSVNTVLSWDIMNNCFGDPSLPLVVRLDNAKEYLRSAMLQEMGRHYPTERDTIRYDSLRVYRQEDSAAYMLSCSILVKRRVEHYTRTYIEQPSTSGST